MLILFILIVYIILYGIIFHEYHYIRKSVLTDPDVYFKTSCMKSVLSLLSEDNEGRLLWEKPCISLIGFANNIIIAINTDS